MSELITYEAVFDEELKGVFGISLVENPATKEMFIQLSEQEQEALKHTEIKLATISEEKRLLVGLVLEPNAPVYRNQDGEEFNIVFSEDTITKLAHNFFVGNYHKNSTLEHNQRHKIKGVTFVESWIVADQKKDKANSFGMEYPAGSWMVTMKVDSDEIWNDYVKTGKVKGFSIDAIVKMKEVKNKTELSMSKVIEKLTKATNDLAVALKLKDADKTKEKPAEIKMGEIMMEGGEIIFEYDGETLEPGIPVFAVDKTELENKIPVPVGKYPLEDGSTLIVTVEGMVGEVIPKTEPVDETPAPAVEPMAAEAAPEKSVVNDIKSILIKYDEMEKRFDAIETQLKEMNKEVVEMAEQPNAKPKTQMAEIKLTKNGRILQKLRENKS